ncbi:MAG TPA: hypothetical protein VG222_04515, partial [Vicinamibacterales bacterium]|nr:hypothetical protein [Vicinamibacterales bacterium]
MFSNRLAFAALGVACIAAAAGGGYLATRQNAVPVQTSAAGAPLPTAATATPTAPAATPQPAQATNASVDNTAAIQTQAALRAPGTPAKSSRDKT